MFRESLTWYEVSERLPDADLTVLVRIEGAEEPLWLGSLQDVWRDVEGFEINVIRWADMPTGDPQ